MSTEHIENLPAYGRHFVDKYVNFLVDKAMENTSFIDINLLSYDDVKEYEACIMYPHEDYVQHVRGLNIKIYTSTLHTKWSMLLSDSKTIEQWLDDSTDEIKDVSRIKVLKWYPGVLENHILDL